MSKWTNCSVRKCIGVYDVLSIVAHNGGDIGESTDALEKTTAEQILNIGESVCNDDRLWDHLPDHLETTTGMSSIDKSGRRKYLKSLLDESR